MMKVVLRIMGHMIVSLIAYIMFYTWMSTLIYICNVSLYCNFHHSYKQEVCFIWENMIWQVNCQKLRMCILDKIVRQTLVGGQDMAPWILHWSSHATTLHCLSLLSKFAAFCEGGMRGSYYRHFLYLLFILPNYR